MLRNNKGQVGKVLTAVPTFIFIFILIGIYIALVVLFAKANLAPDTLSASGGGQIDLDALNEMILFETREGNKELSLLDGYVLFVKGEFSLTDFESGLINYFTENLKERDVCLALGSSDDAGFLTFSDMSPDFLLESTDGKLSLLNNVPSQSFKPDNLEGVAKFELNVFGSIEEERLFIGFYEGGCGNE